jgi:hypothetical protein
MQLKLRAARLGPGLSMAQSNFSRFTYRFLP